MQTFLINYISGSLSLVYTGDWDAAIDVSRPCKHGKRPTPAAVAGYRNSWTSPTFWQISQRLQLVARVNTAATAVRLRLPFAATVLLLSGFLRCG